MSESMHASQDAAHVAGGARRIPVSLPLPPDLPPLPAQPGQWRRASRSIRALLDDPDDTARAIDVFYAIGGGDFERRVRRVLADPEGRRLLAERPSLLDALCDRDRLEALPVGSLGREYLAYLDANGFEPDGLVMLQRQVQRRWEGEGTPPLDPTRAWFRERLQLLHDVSHLVTGYGTDGLGEGALLCFDLGLHRQRAGALLVVGAQLEVVRTKLGPRWLSYAIAAWRRGRRADNLDVLPWERLLPLPLASVRRLARVDEPGAAHPGGIWQGGEEELRPKAA